jgi:ribosomal protein S24E
MEITKEIKNVLLQRKEIVAEEVSGSNPGFAAVTKKLSEHFGASEDLIIVNKIGSHFGTGKFTIDAFVYDNAEAKKKLEAKKKEKKK